MNYYSQGYEIVAKNRMINYYNLNGNCDSGIDIDFVLAKNDQDVNNFKAMIPKDNAEAPFNLRINAKVNYDVKRVLLGFDGKDYYIIYSTVTEDTTVSATIDNRRSSLAIKFIDEKTNELLPNCSVGIDGIVYSIDNTGDKILSKIGKGVVNAKILGVNDDYYVPKDWNSEVLINVKFRENHVEYIKLPHKAGSLKIKTNLEGVEYEIYDKDSNLSQTFFTDDDGDFYIDSLNTGDYILKQVNCPEGYKTIDDIKFTIEHEDECFLELMNEELPKFDGNTEDNKNDSDDKENNDDVEDNIETEDKNQENDIKYKDDTETKDENNEPSNNTEDKKQNNGENDDTDNIANDKDYSKDKDGNHKLSSDNKKYESQDKTDKEIGETKESINTETKSDIMNTDNETSFSNYERICREDRRLPRTGNDYFIEKLIFCDLLLFMLFVCILNYRKLELKN